MAKANSFFKPDNHFLITVGNEIRSLRKSQQLTIEQLSAEANLHSKYLQMVETGKRNISIGALEQVLTKGLKVNLGEFFEKIGY